jgi:hypothetical protein
MLIALTTPSSIFFSLPNSVARLESLQTAGSSDNRVTSSNRSTLASKSKIPPQFAQAGGQIGKLVGNGVDAVSFHDLLLVGNSRGGHYSGAACFTQPLH